MDDVQWGLWDVMCLVVLARGSNRGIEWKFLTDWSGMLFMHWKKLGAQQTQDAIIPVAHQ